jgi:hypothetical protein
MRVESATSLLPPFAAKGPSRHADAQQNRGGTKLTGSHSKMYGPIVKCTTIHFTMGSIVFFHSDVHSVTGLET